MSTERLDAIAAGHDAFAAAFETADRLIDAVTVFTAKFDALILALESAAQAIKDFDGGDPATETGWRHDELRDAWTAARAAIERARAK